MKGLFSFVNCSVVKASHLPVKLFWNRGCIAFPKLWVVSVYLTEGSY